MERIMSKLVTTRADMSSVPTYGGVSVLNVTVAPSFRPVVLKMQVSWGSGKLAAEGVPMEVSAHAVAVHEPPAARFQYTVFGAVNVTPELPLQSPRLLPEIGAAEPAIVISRKSTLSPEKALHVSVTAVPTVAERRKDRLASDAPVDIESVPVIVTPPGEDTTTSRKLKVVDVNDRFLNVPRLDKVGALVAVVIFTS